jgi:uncharacterized protein (TIGR02246 family)
MTVTSDELTAEVIQHAERYVRTFNSGDSAALDQLYADDAVIVWEKGQPVSGKERRAAAADFLALRPRMTTTVKESYVTHDAALLVVEWTIDVDDPEGGTEQLQGTGLDVLRRGADGTWRFSIDNPYGKDL